MTLRQRIVSIVVVGASSVICAAQTRSVPDAGKLTGIVVDKVEGAPVRGAFVLIFSEKSLRRDITRVDAAGRFEISAVPGTYDVLIGASAFAPACKHVVITPGKTARFDAKLGADEENLQESVPSGAVN